MIHVPTDPRFHLVFDLAGWGGGAVLGVALYRWRLKEAVTRIASATGPWYFAALGVGAVGGGWLAGSVNTLRGAHPALSHSIIGALAGAIVAVEIYKAVRGIQGSTGVIFTGSFALGTAVGRWGCLFAGLPDYTYGVPTSLSWGVDLGDGISRHPVQIYESATMAAFLAVYLIALSVRAEWAMKRSFYTLCILYGFERFLVEFLKPYPKVLGPLNLFQLICGGLIAYGAVYYARDLARERRRPGA